MAEALPRAGKVPTVIPLDSCLDRARALQRAGKRWHSHVLSPGCVHNPRPGRYAIVIEDDDGQAFIAPSDVFPEVDKELVKMLHGDDILDARQGGRVRPEDSPLLGRLAQAQAEGVRWHHHMCFPKCMFNPAPGHWTITVESDEGSFFETFADEPVDVLRDVEILYFSNMQKVVEPL